MSQSRSARSRRFFSRWAASFSKACGSPWVLKCSKPTTMNRARALTAIHFGATQGQFDVLLKGHARKEVERLKNHTDSAAAITRQLERVHLGKITALREDGAGGGAIQTRHEV